MNNSLSPYLCFQCQTFPEVAEGRIQMHEGQLMNHNHQDKCRNVRNLQEAYQQIETIERQEKQSAEAINNIRSTLLIQQRKGNTDASFLLRRLP